MKIKPEHYAHMKNAIAALPREKVLLHKEALKDDPRVKDLEMRFRWDLQYAAKLSPWVSETLYSYLNDTHIDTAMRSIVKDLKLA